VAARIEAEGQAARQPMLGIKRAVETAAIGNAVLEVGLD